MKSIEFSPNEITELRNYYKNELEKTLERLLTIKEILNKLDVKNPEFPDIKTESTSKKVHITAHKSETLKENNPAITTTGKIKWSPAIVAKLKQNNSPMSASQLLVTLMKDFNISENQRYHVKQAITNSITRLKNVNKKIRSYKSSDIKGTYYGLKAWFASDNSLLEKYSFIDSTKSNSKKTKTSKKKSRKSSGKGWPSFVINTLSEENSILSSKHLVEIAKEKYNLSKEDYEKARLNIAFALNNLETKKKVLRSVSVPGQRGRSFGLQEWFNADGSIKDGFKK